MKSLNMMVKALKTIADSHRMINQFHQGDLADFLSSGSALYPAMHIELEPTIIQGSSRIMQTEIWLLTRVDKAKNNQLDAVSDMELLALDVISEFKQEPDYRVKLMDENIYINPYQDGLDDEVAGVWFVLQFKEGFAADRCAIPYSTTPVPQDGLNP